MPVFDGRDGITFLRTDEDAPVEYIEKGVYAIATGPETITIRSDMPLEGGASNFTP